MLDNFNSIARKAGENKEPAYYDKVNNNSNDYVICIASYNISDNNTSNINNNKYGYDNDNTNTNISSQYKCKYK